MTLLILADLAFIVVHILHSYTSLSLLRSSLFSIESERAYAEIFQHVKEFWIVILLILLAMRRANFLYLSWSLLFSYILLDDSVEIHERLGAFLAHFFSFQPQFYLRAQDFGELIVFFFFGTMLFGLIAITHYLSDFADRRISKCLFNRVALLLFLGVIVDAVDIIVRHTLATSVLGMIEDGGEMLVMSVIASFVFSSISSCEEISVSSSCEEISVFPKKV